MTSLELEGKRSLVNTEEYLGNTEGSNEVRDHEFINDTSLHSCVIFFPAVLSCKNGGNG